MTDTPYVPTLLVLPGTRVSPEVILHRTLNKKEHIRSVVVVVEWLDGSMDIDWSAISTSKMCMAAVLLQHTATNTLLGFSGTTVPPEVLGE